MERELEDEVVDWQGSGVEERKEESFAPQSARWQHDGFGSGKSAVFPRICHTFSRLTKRAKVQNESASPKILAAQLVLEMPGHPKTSVCAARPGGPGAAADSQAPEAQP